jgi:ADP-ribosylglycohydrolase
LDEFSRLLRGDIGTLPESAIRSGGFVIDTLEAAFWCFLSTDSSQMRF